MGRRNASSTISTTQENTENNTENQENTVTSVTEQDGSDTMAEATETVEQNDNDNTEAEAEQNNTDTEAEAEALAQASMEAFEKAVADAVENRDTATGFVPEVNISEVNAAYRELDGTRAKTIAKKLVGEGMKNALTNMDLTTARAYMNLQEKLSAQGGGSKSQADRTPTDPHEALAQQYAVLSLAHNNIVRSEDIDDEKLQELLVPLTDSAANQKVAEYIKYLTTETPEGDDEPAEPEVEGYVKNAAKLALGRSAKAGAARSARSSGSSAGGSTYSGPRRDVAKHIQEAFSSLPSGTFLTIAKIAEHQSDEYTDSAGTFDKPSQGAISARLFPSGEGKKCTVEGVSPTISDSKKGARKL